SRESDNEIASRLSTVSNPHMTAFSFNAPRDNRDLHSFPTRRSSDLRRRRARCVRGRPGERSSPKRLRAQCASRALSFWHGRSHRSEEHTSELQSQSNLVCRLLLEKKKNGSIGGERDGRWSAMRGRHW